MEIYRLNRYRIKLHVLVSTVSVRTSVMLKIAKDNGDHVAVSVVTREEVGASHVCSKTGVVYSLQDHISTYQMHLLVLDAIEILCVVTHNAVMAPCQTLGNSN